MDLILQVGSEADVEILEANSSVLANESTWFKTILSGRWALKKTQDGKLIIKLPKDDPEDFKLFLKLLNDFNGLDLELDKNDDFELLAAIQELADRYEVVKLQKNLLAWLKTKVEEKLTPETLIQIYEGAKDNGVKGLREAICELVVKNINKFWDCRFGQWLKLDEFAIKLILSDDRTYHKDCYTVYKGLDSVPQFFLARLGSLLHEDSMQVICESQNELLILRKAMEWIDNMNRISNGSPELTLRILQHIRFGKMENGDLLEAIREAQDELTTMQKGELLEFKLLHKDKRNESNLAFKPDDQPRSLPLQHYLKKICRDCKVAMKFDELFEHACACDHARDEDISNRCKLCGTLN